MSTAPAPKRARTAPSVPISGEARGATNRVVVIDLGGDRVRAGYAGEPAPRIDACNGIGRRKGEKLLHVADQVDKQEFVAAFNVRRPFDRGYPTDYLLQQRILTRVMQRLCGSQDEFHQQAQSSTLLMTEPLFCLPAIQWRLDEIAFETLGFNALCRVSPATCALRGRDVVSDDDVAEVTPFAHQAGVVLDSGFSFTHAVPLWNCSPVDSAIRRVNVGGKLLTNFLKDTLSFSKLALRDEFLLCDHIKRESCFVSSDFTCDLQLVRKGGRKRRHDHARDYVMPDGVKRIQGQLVNPRDEEQIAPFREELKTGELQVLPLDNERFTVPELLFAPSDVGLTQSGVAEAVAASIEACPEAIRPVLWSNIVMCGGNVLFPGFQERLHTELRALAPCHVDVRLHVDTDPRLTVWRGAARLATDAEFPQLCVTKAMYDEHGPDICRRMFFH